MIPRISEVASEDWDQLVGPDGFYNTHGWLDSLQRVHGDDPVVIAKDRSGRLLGGLPTWPGEGNVSDLFSLSDMLPDLELTWPIDWLWLGARRSTHNELVGAAGLSRPVLRSLLDRALALARERGQAGVVMPYLIPWQAGLLAGVHSRARVLLHTADTAMTIPRAGLDEYLSRLKKKDRVRRRREMRVLEEAGAHIEWTPFTPDLEADAVRLVTQNRARYGGTADENWMRRTFAAQRSVGILDDAYVTSVRRDNAITAIMVFYGRGDRLYARYFGFDYTRAEQAGEYFVLAYQMPLQYAAKAGFRHYHLGVSAWQSKVRRGAVLSPLAVVVLPLTGEICSPARAADHNTAVAHAWREAVSTRPETYSPAWNAWDSCAPSHH